MKRKILLIFTLSVFVLPLFAYKKASISIQHGRGCSEKYIVYIDSSLQSEFDESVWKQFRKKESERLFYTYRSENFKYEETEIVTATYELITIGITSGGDFRVNVWYNRDEVIYTKQYRGDISPARADYNRLVNKYLNLIN